MLTGSTRSIRVFVSSTFRDMRAERDELAKFAFPALHRLCEDRGVGFTDVDLRWGITDEEVAEGRVLPICLEEIEGCRPYFIGILGERYGWVPDDIPEELVERQPWLAEHRRKSVTELEIIHGVLRSPEMADRAFFYFRDPAYVDSIPPEMRSDFVSEDPASRRRLSALKNRIRASKLPLHEGYVDPAHLARLVEQDMKQVIEEVFPRASVPDPLTRERFAHEAYAASRCAVYVGRDADFRRLDAHADGDTPPLVVTGESGLGKSALLANWGARYREAHPEIPVIEHYTGASASSSDWVAMCRRTLAEISGACGLDLSIATDAKPDQVKTTFKEALYQAGSRRRFVLLIDGVNQLEDRDGAPDLAWLPPNPPPGLRLVVSTAVGRPLDEARRRGWSVWFVEPLDPAERTELITSYLARYRKALTRDQTERLASAGACANPLFLRVLLEELRICATHESVDAMIASHIDVASVNDLYELVLARWEGDYERDRPQLVCDAMVAIWAARRGLDESELLDVLGSDGSALPRATFSPLYLAAEASLVSRSGLLGFAHEFLRQAVEHRYLPDDETRRQAHATLASYFATRERLAPRTVDELPWQYQQARMWGELAGLVGDVGFLTAVRRADAFDQRRYCASLERAGISATDVFADLIAHPDVHELKAIEPLPSLLRTLGHLVEAERLRSHIVDRLRELDDPAKLQSALNKLSLQRKSLGDYEGSLGLLAEAEQICRDTDNRVGLQAALNNRALILTRFGRLSEAMALLRETERICRELGRQAGLESSLFNQAGICRRLGDVGEAERLYAEAERLSREIANPARMLNVLGAQASVRRALGDLDGALALQDEKEQLCRELGSAAALEGVLNNKAHSYMDREDYSTAEELLNEAMAVAERLGDPSRVSTVRNSQARLRREQGAYEDALRLLAERAKLVRDQGRPAELARALIDSAEVHLLTGDAAHAAEFLDEARVIVEEQGEPDLTQRMLGAQAALAVLEADDAAALKALTSQEALCRQTQRRRDLGICLEAQAKLLSRRGDQESARAAATEALQIAEQLGATSAAATRRGLLGVQGPSSATD